MWDMERRQRLGESVPSVFFHSHMVQRLDGMMRPPKTEKLFNCEQAEEIKSQTRDGLTIARDTYSCSTSLSTVETPISLIDSKQALRERNLSPFVALDF